MELEEGSLDASKSINASITKGTRIEAQYQAYHATPDLYESSLSILDTDKLLLNDDIVGMQLVKCKADGNVNVLAQVTNKVASIIECLSSNTPTSSPCTGHNELLFSGRSIGFKYKNFQQVYTIFSSSIFKFRSMFVKKVEDIKKEIYTLTSYTC